MIELRPNETVVVVWPGLFDGKHGVVTGRLGGWILVMLFEEMHVTRKFRATQLRLAAPPIAIEARGPILVTLRQMEDGRFKAALRQVLERVRSVPEGAKVLGVTPTTLHRWLAADPELRKGIDLRQRRKRR